MYATTQSGTFRYSNNFARGASSLTARGADPLTDDQIRRVAPSVFAEQAHDSRSARYAYIPTADVLGGLRAEGFEVFSATQARCRSEDRREHTKHLLRLRHVSQLARTDRDSSPEIVLLNSHDGTSSYQLMGGVFRMVCANGLIVPDGVCQTVKVQHSGQVRDKVTQGAFEVLDGLTRVIDSRDSMRAVTLSDDESRVFAAAALQLRYDEDKPAPIEPAQVLRPRRLEDRAPDLWTTFNRTQENLVRGGLRGRSATGARQSTRAVTGIDQDVKLNRALWTLAEEMRRLKVGA
jgi:hypothetical protein